ncbi:hypothetical protein IJ913_02620, partial [bacterium]|nr:hypothetical protein [bacterium]
KLKPIRIENLIAEFQDLKSHTKEIGRITDLNLESLSQKFKKKNSNIEITLSSQNLIIAVSSIFNTCPQNNVHLSNHFLSTHSTLEVFVT